METEESGEGRDRLESSGESGGFRAPPVLMLPGGLGVGWMMANWIGAVLGGVIGYFLWRSRA
jgi:hypothetical protein